MFMQPQTKTNRPLGNAQSRLSAMPAAPAYGNTTNVNGAQTAIMNPIRRPGGAVNLTNPIRATPEYMSAMGIEQEDPITLTGGQAAVGGMSPQSPQLPFSSTMQGNGQASYPGGNAPGIASYYRNSAVQGYQGAPMVPNSPLQSNAVSQSQQYGQYADDTQQISAMDRLRGKIDALTTKSQIANAPALPNGPVDIEANAAAQVAPIIARDAAKQQNTPANGNTAFANDPNRLTPDQKADLARKSALDAAGGGPAADPTGLGGRFGGAMGQQATADAEAIQSGQAVRLADGSVARFTGTPESAREAQNKGKVEREKLRDRSNTNVPQEELDRRKAADAAKKERADRHQAFRDENNGMNYRQYDRFQKVRQSISRKVATGRMDPTTAALMLEQETNKAMRRAQGRKSAMDAPAAAAPPDRVPLPNGQLPEETRQRAATTAKNMTDPEFTGGSPQFKQEAEVVRSLGLKSDHSVTKAAEVIMKNSFPLENNEAALRTASALRRYWSSMKDSNADWANNQGMMGIDPADPTVLKMMAELTTTPEDKMQEWIDKWSGHLASFGQQQSGPSDTMPMMPVN